mmetsp:Transcript_8165/g.18246  ORF Transcript_8165/g.18246 Transcript_8165/m.18246 type:complete len:205 (-) Transcript_8165:324-938(-)
MNFTYWSNSARNACASRDAFSLARRFTFTSSASRSSIRFCRRVRASACDTSSSRHCTSTNSSFVLVSSVRSLSASKVRSRSCASHVARLSCNLEICRAFSCSFCSYRCLSLNVSSSACCTLSRHSSFILASSASKWSFSLLKCSSCSCIFSTALLRLLLKMAAMIVTVACICSTFRLFSARHVASSWSFSCSKLSHFISVRAIF